MNRPCPQCHVEVHPSNSHCPLCSRLIESQNPQDILTQYPIPPYKWIKQQLNRILFRLGLFFTVMAFLLSLSMYILWFPNSIFLYLVGWIVFYSWILIGNTILSPSLVGQKLLAQVISVGALLWIINDAFQGDWFYSYAVPLLIVLYNAVMVILVMSNKSVRKNELLGLVIWDLIGLLFSIVNLFWNPLMWPFHALMLVSVTSLFIILLFNWHHLEAIIKRFFHV